MKKIIECLPKSDTSAKSLKKHRQTKKKFMKTKLNKQQTPIIN